LDGKRILLIVGGGIAAYKSLELVRLIKKAGGAVTVILTRAGEQFVTSLSLAALAGEPVRADLFSLDEEAQMGHIELSRSADLIVVAPATANLMAKAAHGLCDDLASTTLLATDTKVLMAPAMNVRMWEHPATQANLQSLKEDGVLFVGPDEGEMACGEYGPGRMAEPEAILEAIQAALPGAAKAPIAHAPAAAKTPPATEPTIVRPRKGPLTGKRVLVTAGPTVEHIDPVRVLTNLSSGKQGYAIASALAALGAEVTLVSGPTALPAPAGVKRVDVVSATDMLAACQAALPADAAVCVAAVADWRPESSAPLKVAKGQGSPSLKLVQNPDILAELSRPGKARPKLVVGFAAETHEVLAHAQDKLKRKGCDWIVANDVSGGDVMGGDENAATLIAADGSETWPRASKDEIARRLADHIAKVL
jgi:phosphopantothenoylcysteine decarboxylase/phosphopantothenate--cysteine ligase